MNNRYFGWIVLEKGEGILWCFGQFFVDTKLAHMAYALSSGIAFPLRNVVLRQKAAIIKVFAQVNIKLFLLALAMKQETSSKVCGFSLVNTSAAFDRLRMCGLRGEVCKLGVIEKMARPANEEEWNAKLYLLSG